jgi:hypothetical protein
VSWPQAFVEAVKYIAGSVILLVVVLAFFNVTIEVVSPEDEHENHKNNT